MKTLALLSIWLALPLAAQTIYEIGQFPITSYQAGGPLLIIRSDGIIRACEPDSTTCVVVDKDGKVSVSDGLTMERAVALALRSSTFLMASTLKRQGFLEKELSAALLQACRAPDFKIVGKSMGSS